MSSFQEEPTQRIDWETPQWFFDYWHKRLGFQTDVCANDQNAKCARYFTEELDGLSQHWSGMCWMNPPYGRGVVGPWVKKAYESAAAGDATVACLLPVRSDNPWWRYITHGEVIFIEGRVKFVGAPSGAMFPSVLCIFHGHLDPAQKMKVVSTAEMKAEARNAAEEKL